MPDDFTICCISTYPPKVNCMTSAVYLNTALKKAGSKINITPWNYEGKIKTTVAPITNFAILRNACRQNRIVHVQYDLAGYMPLFLPALLLARLFTPAKLVLTLHEDFANLPFSHGIRWYHHFWYVFFNALIVHTPQHKAFLPRILHKKTVVQPHGVILRKTARETPAVPIIVLPGFVNRWKGHTVAIRALAQVLTIIPNAGLIIVGKTHDAAYAAEIRQLIIHLKLDNHIFWADGYVSETELFGYLQNATLAILPYERTTMSGILCHLISYRIPTIMTDLPPFRWFTKNRAMYFKKGDSVELAQKIIGLIKNDTACKEMEIQFGNLSTEYDWENTAKKTMGIYFQVDSDEGNICDEESSNNHW